MNILITGVAGFIGSHTAEKFLAEGHSIVGIDNFDPFYPRHFKLHNMDAIKESKRFTFLEGDILNKELLNKLFEDNNIEAVIHLAAKAGVRPSIDNIEEYYQANITGTLNLLECMRVKGITKMLFASSSSIYGNNIKIPFSETDRVDNPISPYASTKKSGELLCHVYSHLYGFDISCLRFFTVFGPRQRPDLAIHKFTRLIGEGKPIPIFGDGSTGRDYTYVSDITDGIMCAFQKLKGYNIFNLGESRVILLKDLIKVIEDRVQRKAVLDFKPKQPGDVEITFADIEKAKTEIGYNPQFDLKTGVDIFVSWYLINESILYRGQS
ncbi:MAG TPA: GDP-mannose 4,6-dehydratase [Puia sp.]|jgi:UDP-glucuronate 4-epimerase|nr:GDP-mannose 4,6-dehydratase [Puia sp.]